MPALATMRRLLLLLLLLPLPLAAQTTPCGAASALASGSASSFSTTFLTIPGGLACTTNTGDGLLIQVAAPGLSGGNVIATPTITGCGSTTVTPLDATGNGTSQLNTYVAMNLPNTCTGVSVSSSLGGTSNRWSIATVVLRGLPTSYIVENYTHNPTQNVLSLTMNTLEASSLLISTTVDDNAASSFTPSAGFTTLLTQSAHTPGMMVSTDSGGPAAYTSNPTGCVSTCWQSLVVIRSVLPAFGVMQFSHVNSGTGTSLTCTLPFPSTAADGLIGTAIPFGSSDTCAVPHDDQSNAYKQIGSVLPTSNGAGCMFYAKNITASSSPVITFPTLNGGSATTFTTRCAETRGASPVAPYSASTQSYQKNYPITTNFQFGPATLPVGNYLMIGEGYVGTENYPFTVTNGTQLGNFEDPTHGLTNFFLAPFSSSGAPYTMTVTPSSGQPANLVFRHLYRHGRLLREDYAEHFLRVRMHGWRPVGDTLRCGSGRYGRRLHGEHLQRVARDDGLACGYFYAGLQLHGKSGVYVVAWVKPDWRQPV